MSGRGIVITLVTLALVGAIGSTWYRRATRPTLARDLEAPEKRAQAVLKLLRANNLWGLAQDHFHDARKESQGTSYIFAKGDDGAHWHVVRAVNSSQPGKAQPCVLIFSEDGVISSIVEGGIPLLLAGTPEDGLASVVSPTPEAVGSSSISTVGKAPIEELRIAGSFLINQIDGPAVRVGEPSSESAATFRFDRDANKWRGPQGGTDKPWQVDRDHSPRYAP